MRRFLRENRAIFVLLSVTLALYLILLAFNDPRREPRRPAFSTAELQKKEATARQELQARPVVQSSLAFGFLGLLLAGFVADVRYLRRPKRVSAFQSDVRWGFREVIETTVFMFFSEAILVLFESLWIRYFELIPDHDFLLMMNSFLRDLLVVAYILRMMQIRFGLSFKHVGLSLARFGECVRRGLSGYVAVIPPLFFSVAVLSYVIKMFSYEPPPQNVVEIFLKPSADQHLVFFTFFVAALGPMVEEIFFRGFAYPAFRKKWGPLWGAVIMSAIFAAFHFNAVAFLPIFVLSLFLTYLYETTGTLVAPITAHVAHNLIMVSMTLGFKSLAGF